MEKIQKVISKLHFLFGTEDFSTNFYNNFLLVLFSQFFLQILNQHWPISNGKKRLLMIIGTWSLSMTDHVTWSMPIADHVTWPIAADDHATWSMPTNDHVTWSCLKMTKLPAQCPAQRRWEWQGEQGGSQMPLSGRTGTTQHTLLSYVHLKVQ